MTADIHFVQGGDEPVLIGSGTGTLACSCGNVLVQGYQEARFLGIAMQCARCGAVTTTPLLADDALPPRSAIVASPSATPRTTAMTVPADVSVVGQAEMRRLQARFQPADPDSTYQLSDALLDKVAAAFEQHAGGRLPTDLAGGEDGGFAGLRDHALGWAVRHLRARLRTGDWACMENAPTANAVTHVTGFLHFLATWPRHPLFPVMLETAAAGGFSLHALAPFAAAHCLTMMGNRIRFPEPLTYPGRIEGFQLVADPEPVGVAIEVFDRFEFPFGRPWDAPGLQAAVADLLGAAQSRINLRHPGLLVLSPGTALAGFDEALIAAVKSGVHLAGRRNRGLMAVAVAVLRLQPLQDPHAVRFGYGFFPTANRHYRGPGLPQAGEQTVPA